MFLFWLLWLLKIYMSQISVATHLRCGWPFSNRRLVTTNFIQNLPVTEVGKSVNIWQRYGQWQSETFFESVCYCVLYSCDVSTLLRRIYEYSYEYEYEWLYWVYTCSFCILATWRCDGMACVDRIPFYYEIKILFMLWLLSPTTRGSSIIYRKLVHPQLNRRESVN